LNAVLLAVESARRNRSLEKRVGNAATFGEVLACLPEPSRLLAEVRDPPGDILRQEIGPIVVQLLSDVYYSGLRLHPSLLLRHASSRLYQEAHLQIERDPQLTFAGMAPETQPRGFPQRDVRFTPTNLARTLVQQAVLALDPFPSNLTVLDPACGSGVFLQEFLKEMSLRGFSGKTSIVGYDVSDISACMSRFCLNTAARDLRKAHISTDIDIYARDSLKARCWIKSDMILMNPPFVPWAALNAANQSLVRETLGEMSGGRPDIAMAFVWNAIMALKPGGVLACVLPAALLSSTSGRVWRERIQSEGEIILLGRFDGYRYFATSLVETSFLVFRRNLALAADGTSRQGPVQVLVASEGCEDASLRALRLAETDPRRRTPGVQVFRVSACSLLPDSWRPQREETYQQLALLRSHHGSVQDLFKIRQGIRIGEKAAFVLSADQYHSLPQREVVYFRPCVGNNTLQDGRLVKKEFIFFPYDENGLQIKFETDLQRLVPRYYERWLQPQKDLLKARQGIRHWWELTRHRAWQTGKVRHLVSTYFGKRGCFAYNSTGDFVVANGHAWMWKGDQQEFEESLLPWAYVALLNSEPFERILSWTCVRLQGGQFRLEERYLAKVPLPDLSDETRYSSAVVGDLAELGKAIGKGQLGSVCGKVDRLAGSLLGLG
jgi:hypothetical protein